MVVLAAAVLLPLAFWPPMEDAFKLPQALLAAGAALWLLMGGRTVAGGWALPAWALAGWHLLSLASAPSARLPDCAWFAMLALLAPVAAGASTAARIPAGMVLAGALSSAFALVQLAGVDPTGAGSASLREAAGARPFSTMGNPDFTAAYLVAVLPLAFMAWVRRPGPWAAVVAVLMLAAAMFAQSRGAWIGLAVAAVVGVVAYRRFPRRDRAGDGRRAVTAAVAGLVLAGIFMALHAPSRARLVGALDPGHFDAAGRLAMWRGAALTVRKAPVTGIGLGGFGSAYPRLHAGFIRVNPSFPWFFTENAHNDYLQLAAEEGVIGLGLWAWACAVFLRLVLAAARRGEGAGLGLGLGLAAVLADSVFNFPAYLVPVQAWFWLSMGYLAHTNAAHADAAHQHAAHKHAAHQHNAHQHAAHQNAAHQHAAHQHAAHQNAAHQNAARQSPVREYTARQNAAGIPAWAAALLMLAAGILALRDVRANLWLKLSGDFTAAGRWREALFCSERSAGTWLAWEGRSRPVANAALAAYNLNDLPGAELWARRALAAAPGSPSSLNQLGLALARQGRLDEAVRVLNEALELNPHQGESWHALGNIAWLRRDRAGAARMWRRALEENPGLTGARDSLDALEGGGGGKKR